MLYRLQQTIAGDSTIFAGNSGYKGTVTIFPGTPTIFGPLLFLCFQFQAITVEDS